MTNHSLINASANTHAKTAFLAIAASMVFMAVVSASGVTKSDARASGPAVKTTATMSVAASGTALVR